jgi:hypothetical protein
MAVQLSTSVRNAMLDAVESHVGASAVLKIRTGPQPATCATADSGVVLVAASLPADWMSAASGGSKALAGSWSDTSADTSGTAGHWRLYASDGTTCHAQGAVGYTGAASDLTLAQDSAAIVGGQAVTISSFTLTMPGA